MKKIIFYISFLSIVLYGQDFRENATYSLFSDVKASQVGDAITILVVETSQAQNTAQTSHGRKNSVGFNASGKAGDYKLSDIQFGAGSKNDFSGGGATKANGLIRTKISATIDSVLPNGNLLVKGSRKLSINGEDQTIFIKGVVRRSDIMPDNSVLSYNISEAEIIIDGNGFINDSQKPSWIMRVLNWIF